LKSTCLTMALVLWSVSATFAQTPIGTLEGTVADSTGGAIVGATTVTTNTDTNQSRTVVTDSAGAFRFAQLSVGMYRVQVTFPGFAAFAQDGVVLTIGQTVHLTITLMPSGVAETVGVTARPLSPLDIRQTAVTTTVDTERIEELPVQSRDYLHFVLLAPGVVSSHSASQSRSEEHTS